MLRLSLIGSPYWVEYLKKTAIGDEFLVSSYPNFMQFLRKPYGFFSADRIMVVGHGFPDSISRLLWFVVLRLRLMICDKSKIIFYWIGSEVYRPPGFISLFMYKKLSKSPRVQLICGASWFIKKLAQFDLEAKLLQFPYDVSEARKYSTYWPICEKLVVSTYLTERNWENSRGDLIFRLISEIPAVHWNIYGMTASQVKKEFIPNNVKFWGWVNSPLEIMKNSHVCCRFTKVDGYAGTIRDAQAMKRIVIYTKPTSDCIYIPDPTFSNIKCTLEKIQNIFQNDNDDWAKNLRSTGASSPDFSKNISDLINVINNRD